MDIRILGVKYKNIREFENLEISFIKDEESLDNYHISLIQMPNGTGKTTTINLINYAITGSELSPDYIKSLEPINNDSDSGSFELHMKINEEFYAVRIELDYLYREFKYITSRPKIKGGGKQSAHLLPEDVKNIATKKFTDLFVFDGELSKKLLNSKYSAAEDAIKVIYSLDKLSLLDGEIDELITQKQELSESGVRSFQGLKQQQSRLSNLREYRRKLKEEQLNIKSEIAKNKEKFKSKQESRDNIFLNIKEVYDTKNELSNDLIQIEQSIKIKSNEFLFKIRSPANYSYFFHQELKNLAGNLVKLKLPKTTSREFFIELSESNLCICGEEINEDRKRIILENAAKYLSGDDIDVMNVVKGSIKGIPNFDSLELLVEEMNNEKIKYYGTKQKLDKIAQELPENIQKEINLLDKEINDLKDKIEELTFQEEIISSNDKDFISLNNLKEKDNLFVCGREIESLEHRIAAATETILFKNQASVFKQINENVIERSLSKIKEKIISESNQKLFKLLSRDDILITDIHPSITIQKKKGVSEGQSLAIAYSYLATLFEGSNHNIPFVIDSPAGSLDKEVRHEVSSTIPSLYKQLIIFILSSERDGFIDGIQFYKDIQYLTVYKDKMSRNIITNYEKDFFMCFQDIV